MQLEQRRQAMFQLHRSYQQFNYLLWCALYYRLDGVLFWPNISAFVAFYWADNEIQIVRYLERIDGTLGVDSLALGEADEISN